MVPNGGPLQTQHDISADTGRTRTFAFFFFRKTAFRIVFSRSSRDLFDRPGESFERKGARVGTTAALRDRRAVVACRRHTGAAKVFTVRRLYPFVRGKHTTYSPSPKSRSVTTPVRPIWPGPARVPCIVRISDTRRRGKKRGFRHFSYRVRHGSFRKKVVQITGICMTFFSVSPAYRTLRGQGDASLR